MSYQPIGEGDLATRLRELADSLPTPTADEFATMARRAAGVPSDGAQVIPLRRRSRLATAVLAAAAAAVVVGAVLTATLLRQPTVAAAGVRFSHSNGFIIAHITDPKASAAALSKAFAEQGLNIHLSLAPASPSLVGTVLYVGGDDTSASSGIEALQGGTCLTGGGGCPVGLRISRGYRGEAYITLGRAARAGESYATTTSIFAPGEPLHCSGLIGKPAAKVRKALLARGFVAVWGLFHGNGERITATQAASDYVVDAEHTAPDRVAVSVSVKPLSRLDSETTSYLDRLQVNCR